MKRCVVTHNPLAVARGFALSLQEQYTLWLFCFAMLTKKLTRSCGVFPARLTRLAIQSVSRTSLRLAPIAKKPFRAVFVMCALFCSAYSVPV